MIETPLQLDPLSFCDRFTAEEDVLPASQMIRDLEQFLAAALAQPAAGKQAVRWPLRYNSTRSAIHGHLIRD